MEYWEFLLQKEGDQAWLPLESSQVEILEGRYRIMAHTSQPHCPVSVRISHRLAETPAKRRLMRRSDQTNEMGLMVVMPFTWLKPGLWEVHCAATTATEAQQYAIQLQVVSQDRDDLDEWFPEDWPSDRAHPGDLAAFPELTGSAPASTPAPIPEAALQAAFEAIDQALAEAVLSGEERSPQGLGLSTTHRIELAQSALMVNQGQTLMVVGKVEAAREGLSNLPLEASTESSAGAVITETSRLALRLLDPQSATVLVQEQHDLAAQPLPATFVIPVELPAALSTRLLLGELILLEAGPARLQVKAVQRFTVTVDLAALFDAIANQAEAEPALGIVFAADGSGEESLKNIAGLDLEPAMPVDTDLPVPPPRSMPTLLLPTSGLALPPKLYYPAPGAAPPPTLPSIPRAEPKAEAVQAKPAEPPARAAEPGRGGLKLPEFGRRPAPAPAPVSPPAPPAPPPSPVEDEFRTLNLQERFWSRLNALAVEAYESAASRQAEIAAASAAAQPAAVDPEAWRETAFAGEVVIYEEPLAPGPEPALSPTAETAETVLSPPAPQLELPEGELISGDRVSITLRVPPHPNRLYLKVWITDPQTRTLADEPRQLSQLTPDGRGNLEGTLSLIVPMGCLEAWFEAISVDLVTQQESYKTSVSRPVMPPELGAAPPDELSF